jgi:hypothetical protein
VFDDGTNEHLPDAVATPLWQHEHVGDVAEDRIVRDHSTESYLMAKAVRSEAKGVRDGHLDDLPRPALGPVRRAAEEVVNEPDIDPAAIGGHFKLVVTHASSLSASFRRSLSFSPTDWQDPDAGRGLVDGHDGALLKRVFMGE